MDKLCINNESFQILNQSEFEVFLDYLLSKRGESRTLNDDEKLFFSELKESNNSFSFDLYIIFYFVETNSISFKNAIIRYYIMYFSYNYNYIDDLINNEEFLKVRYKEIGKSQERYYLFFEEIKIYKLLTDLKRNKKLSFLQLKIFKLLKAINSGKVTNKQAFINIEKTPKKQLKLKENEVGLRIENISRDISREEFLEQVEKFRDFIENVLGIY